MGEAPLSSGYFTSYGVVDISNPQKGRIIANVPATVGGHMEPLTKDFLNIGNTNLFVMQNDGTSQKDYLSYTGETYVNTYEYKDGKVTLLASTKIDHDADVHPEATVNGSKLIVEFHKMDKEQTLVGVMEYKFDSKTGKFIPGQQVFKQ